MNKKKIHLFKNRIKKALAGESRARMLKRVNSAIGKDKQAMVYSIMLTEGNTGYRRLL